MKGENPLISKVLKIIGLYVDIMKINIEVQSLMSKNFRGIPVYVRELLNQLLVGGKNQYSVSYFDYRKERDNNRIVKNYIDQKYISQVKFYECNTISYKDVMNNSLLGTEKIIEKNFSDYFDIGADVYHFPNMLYFGLNIPDKSIVTVHDLIPFIFRGRGWFNRDREDMFYNTHKYIQQRKDVQVIVPSEATKKDLIEYLGVEEQRIFITYEAYNEKLMFPERQETTLRKFGIYEPYILYIGALDPRKGIIDIVEAFGKIQEINKELILVLSGKPTESTNQYQELEWINTLPYKNRIIFTGYVTETEKRHLLSSAEIFVFPSEYEGFGLPVLEAMACGCPVITSNVSSLPEVGGDAALYVPTKKSDVLTERILELLKNENLKHHCIEQGYRQAKKFSWEKTARLTEQVYENIFK